MLIRFIGYPIHDVGEERSAGAIHTAEVAVIAGLDRLKAPEQKLLLYSLLLYSLLLYSLSLCSLYPKALRVNCRRIEKMRAYWSRWLGREPPRSQHGQNLR